MSARQYSSKGRMISEKQKEGGVAETEPMLIKFADPFGQYRHMIDEKIS